MMATSLAATFGDTSPTPLVASPALARLCGVARIFIKDETKRYLGNFKSLGGIHAALSALARVAGVPDLDRLRRRPGAQLPTLLCGSAGNHGLAVASAAQLAGTTAKIYLHKNTDPARVARILQTGAEIIEVRGTFDDAVEAARHCAERGGGLLIPDTSEQEDDPVVRDIITGYRVIATEVLAQKDTEARLTHVFVQAGVGGLAAAIAEGLRSDRVAPVVVVVEPDTAPCVAAALRVGRPVRLDSSLDTAASMLACGQASAPALAMLTRHAPTVMTVNDGQAIRATAVLARECGIRTTPSGAAGLAGLLSATRASIAESTGLGRHSEVLLIATECSL